MKRSSLAALLLALTSVTAGGAKLENEKFGSIYAGKLDYEEEAVGRSWTSLPEDVWELESFSYALDKQLEIELGPSVVVFGKHVDEKGRKSVVWAAVIPHEAAREESIVAYQSSRRAHVKSIFMRFHPSLVGKLFPKKTVVGQGDALMGLWGRRIYSHKINSHWQAENMPVVPWKHSLVFDIETVEGVRNCYMVDAKKKQAEYVDAFAQRTIPEAPGDPIESERALELFDQAWEIFDREYAMFSVKPQVDWKALREFYRPIASKAQTRYELAGVIGMLLTHLEDLHVWVKVGGDWIPGYNRMRQLNANWNAVKAEVAELIDTKRGVSWGELSGGIGYVSIWDLSTSGLSDAFDEALEGLGSTRGLIIDLRFNGGGDELLGRRIAGRFAAEELVYSISRYRNGEGHEDLGPEQPRTLEPRGPWRYESPVVVLIGQKTMSSAESLALMLAGCPEVTTMGDRTAGSSANPRRLELEGDIVINLPQWLDLDPEGRPIDAVGIAPMKSIAWSSTAKGDPVFEAAHRFMKKHKGSKPGKR